MLCHEEESKIKVPTASNITFTTTHMHSEEKQKSSFSITRNIHVQDTNNFTNTLKNLLAH